MVKPGIDVYIGVPGENKDATKVLWFANPSKVEGFVNEERVLSTVEAMATEACKRNANSKEGDPIVSLSGSDVRKTIEEKLEKIREKESQLTELYKKPVKWK